MKLVSPSADWQIRTHFRISVTIETTFHLAATPAILTITSGSTVSIIISSPIHRNSFRCKGGTHVYESLSKGFVCGSGGYARPITNVNTNYE